MALVRAAINIITEKRLPAAISDSENVWRISGNAMPRLATIIDGIRLEQGTMQTDRKSRRCDSGVLFGSMARPYFSVMKT
jgi:hypothetical protein